jgi:hypothetical protein
MLNLFRLKKTNPHDLAVEIGNQINTELPGDDTGQLETIVNLARLWGRFDTNGNRLTDAQASQRINQLIDSLYKP